MDRLWRFKDACRHMVSDIESLEVVYLVQLLLFSSPPDGQFGTSILDAGVVFLKLS